MSSSSTPAARTPPAQVGEGLEEGAQGPPIAPGLLAQHGGTDDEGGDPRADEEVGGGERRAVEAKGGLDAGVVGSRQGAPAGR